MIVALIQLDLIINNNTLVLYMDNPGKDSKNVRMAISKLIMIRERY